MAKKNAYEPVALSEYIARVEAQAQPLVVCAVTHPDALDGAVHEGTYSGIRLTRGTPASALLSSGETLTDTVAEQIVRLFDGAE